MTILRRILVSAAALSVAAWVVPGTVVSGLVAAVEGALIVAVVSWVLQLVLPDKWDGKR